MTRPACERCDAREWCPVHVQCDEDCRALAEPKTLADALVTIEHWEEHGWLAGCAHGC